MADEAGARGQVAQLAFAAVVLVVLMFLNGSVAVSAALRVGERFSASVWLPADTRETRRR
jgi:hypothetical protein